MREKACRSPGKGKKNVANTFREFASAKAYIMLNLAVLCCVAGISYSVFKLDHEHHLDTLKQDAQQALYEVTSQVQNQFQETVLVTKNIENILLSGEAFKDKKIRLLVKAVSCTHLTLPANGQEEREGGSRRQ